MADHGFGGRVKDHLRGVVSLDRRRISVIDGERRPGPWSGRAGPSRESIWNARAWLGSTTTSWAARTTSPSIGSWPRPSPASPRRSATPCGPTGRSCAGPCDSWLAAGVTQFLDIGSGIPTVGNVHDIARRADPSARVVYVDIDPIAVSHSRVILAGDPRTAVIQADARDTERILEDPETSQVLDLDRPVAVLLVGVLDYVPDAHDPVGIVRRLRDAVCPGSYVALVNATHENQPAEVVEAQKLLGRTGTPIHLRSRRELLDQFAGLTLVEPGLVHLPLWRPDSPLDVDGRPERFGALAGIGRKDGR